MWNTYAKDNTKHRDKKFLPFDIKWRLAEFINDDFPTLGIPQTITLYCRSCNPFTGVSHYKDIGYISSFSGWNSNNPFTRVSHYNNKIENLGKM